MLDANGNKLDQVFFNQKKSKDNSVIHSGDDRTGEGAGDDETIQIFLDQVHPAVDSVWFVITIYNEGQQFDDV